jgi:hypothetical protein
MMWSSAITPRTSVKRVSRAVYLPMYTLQRITPAEAARVTVAFLNDHPTPPLMMRKEHNSPARGEWRR